MTKLFAFLLLGGCTLEVKLGNDGPSDTRTEVALVPVTAMKDVDVLFVIDDSPSGGADLQLSLQQAFPVFLQTLAGAGSLPNLHIGVVSSDVGTKGADDAIPGPGIGSGPGSCSSTGKNGVLQNAGAVVTGAFISDVDIGGVRDTNYTGSLVDAFASISSLGASGCGFEQPLHAARLAVANSTNNAGFLRGNAQLAVVVVANEDDCSFKTSTLISSDTSTFGPLQSFRCTRFGVACDEGGRTTDEMNSVGTKSRCHANEASPYLISVSGVAEAIKSTKGDARNVMFATIAGVASSLEVAMESPPGGGTAIPNLRPACVWPSTSPLDIDPAIRLTDAAAAFRRSYVQMACGADMTAPAIGIAREIRSMMGDACLTRGIASPADCEGWDTRADGSITPLPSCGTGSSECFRFVQDASCGVSGLRVEVVRITPPPTDTMVSVRCKL
jgi:hypothetical protein